MNVNRFTLILITGIAVVYRLVYKIDEDFFLDGILNVFTIIAATTVMIGVIVRDVNDYKLSRSSKQLLPTFTSVLFLLVIAVSLYALNRRDNTPTIVFASYSGDFNGASLDLRANGTYKFTNYALGADYFRGKYTIKDSVIILDKSDIDNVIRSNRLVIRSAPFVPGTGLMIYQINKQGQVLEDELSFQVRRITGDNVEKKEAPWQ